ncbi:uncharacterized protein [Penaeus vannamei]|uniref:uncharacterized protein isoform X3 n=1 Tax=Penaeus vannamei TaxID=6689 RepID=UPI000F66D6C7|nr:uncharacterized protein LOC113802357 isoform X2 [Penaeus vannamei]
METVYWWERDTADGQGFGPVRMLQAVSASDPLSYGTTQDMGKGLRRTRKGKKERMHSSKQRRHRAEGPRNVASAIVLGGRFVSNNEQKSEDSDCWRWRRGQDFSAGGLHTGIVFRCTRTDCLRKLQRRDGIRRDALQFHAVGHGRPGTLRPLPSPLLPRGTKIDLRKNAQSTSSVSRREGRRLAARLGMSNYVECSAKTGQGCQQAFRSAIQATTAKPTCILL